jgi:hypothetical protein
MTIGEPAFRTCSHYQGRICFGCRDHTVLRITVTRRASLLDGQSRRLRPRSPPGDGVFTGADSEVP